jgi:adenosine deaminase
MRKEDYIEAIFDGIAEFERSKLGQKTGLKTKLMLSIDRADTYAVAEQTVDLALLYKSRGVVGLDLAGNPHVCLAQISRS